MAFRTIDWVNHMLDNDESQKTLIEFAEKLIDGPLKDKGEYGQEKALKVFSEGISYHESILQYQEGIHRSQFDPIDFVAKKDQYFKSMVRVKDIIQQEIERQYNLFLLLFQMPASTVEGEIPALKNSSSEKLLREYQEKLESYLLKDRDEASKNAGVLLFTEGLSYLETLSLYQAAIITNRDFSNSKTAKELFRIEKVMESEMKRQFRHFTTFM